MTGAKDVSLEADYLTLRMKVERPARGRRPARIEEIRVEISTSSIRLWDEPPGGELYNFDGTSQGNVSEPLSKMPRLDEIHRILADRYVTNRSNLVGAHLEHFVKAAESAIAARDGSSVYFAEAGNRVKIGFSKRVSARLVQLQTGSAVPIRLIGTMPGGRTAERRLHDQFAHLRISGEWFQGAPELLEHVGALVAASKSASAV